MKKFGRAVALLLIAVLVISGCARKGAETDEAVANPASEARNSADETDYKKAEVKTGTETGTSTTEPAGTDYSKGESSGTGYSEGESSGTDYSEGESAGTVYSEEEAAEAETYELPSAVVSAMDSVKPDVRDYSMSEPAYASDGDYATDFDTMVTSEKTSGLLSGAEDEIMSGDKWIRDPLDPIVPIEPIDPIDPWMPEPVPVIPVVEPHAGLLTAGEWNDNRNLDFLRELLANGQQCDYKEFFNEWGLRPFNRLTVHVTSAEGNNLRNVNIEVCDEDGNLLGTSRTDNQGISYVFYNLSGNTGIIPKIVRAAYGDQFVSYELVSSDLMDDSIVELSFADAYGTPKTLDLMMVIDTTGSMGDEIRYLQVELEDVINRVRQDNANLPVRLSVNFYRDIEDDYVVRSYPFSSNIDDELGYLRVEYADGGGDYEEAVEQALEDAVYNHEWDQDSIKLMFIVLDAPPHNTEVVRQSLMMSISEAARQGIRIIPVASSGVDKSTEFLLRAMAMITGGTYTFLTDDSGIGGGHIEPTVGSYDVENLNDLMVRIISEYIM